nr:unnamed protein product [Callosobruchus analis]
MAQIKVGDKLPPGIVLYEDKPENQVILSDYAVGKRLIITGVPGAFTPVCSRQHLPQYIEKADELRSKRGIHDIICIVVNDPFVVSAWCDELGARGRVMLKTIHFFWLYFFRERCESSTFTKKPLVGLPTVEMEGGLIVEAPSIKLLGINVNNNKTWREHYC